MELKSISINNQFSNFLVASAIMIMSCLTSSCVRQQVVENCEIHGEIRSNETDLPVSNMMIFARYSFNKDRGSNTPPIVVGPFFSDENGRFVIPKSKKSQWYIEMMYMGDCGADLLFIHPNRGAFSMLTCSEDFPSELPYKDLKVVQRMNSALSTKKDIQRTYWTINSLPIELQSIAWQHVDSDLRN